MTLRRGFGDALMSAGALAVLLIALVSIDPGVREQLGRIAHDGPSSGLSSVGTSMGDIASAIFSAVRYHSIEHAPMVTFVVAATILVVAMLRT